MSKEDAKKQLRKYLNPSIRGTNTDIILESLASGPAHLIDNVQAIDDQMYLVSATGRYLDALLADRNIVRPDEVGLSDDVFREIGIEVSNRKQVRDLINQLLFIMYGQEKTNATMVSSELEPYELEDGDTLTLKFDATDSVTITFTESQFTNINQATAQEVADAITKGIRKLGRTGAAIAKDDGSGGYVMLISSTIGASSSVQVQGGKSQNKLRFPTIRLTSGEAATQWTLSSEAGGVVRATWTGGPNPSLGKVNIGDYINIYGNSFDEDNRGTFTVSAARGGLVGDAYVEYENPSGVPETVLQGNVESVLFFYSSKNIVSSKNTYAAAYQVESRLLEIYIPATTKVIRRNRAGAAHIHTNEAATNGDYGPHLFDESKPYVVSSEQCLTTARVDSSIGRLIEVDDSTDIPDETGFLVFGFGTAREEGPVPYISRPSTNSILLDPSYQFENIHPAGTNVMLISQNYIYDINNDGSDFPFYVTDIVSGREYAEELIETYRATGINLVVTVLYPDPIGLSKWREEDEDRQEWLNIWE